MVKKSIGLVFFVLSNCLFGANASAPVHLNYSAGELATIARLRKEDSERRFAERKRAFMKQNPSLIEPEAEAILEYEDNLGGTPLIVDFWEPKANPLYLGPKVFGPLEAITDKNVWSAMNWRSWDQLKSPLRELALERQFREYETSLEKRLEDYTSGQIDDLPKPIQLFHYIRELRYWSDHYNKGRPQGELEQISNKMLGIMLCESYASKDVVYFWSDWENKKDLGIMQLNKSTIASLKKKDDFRDHKEEDFHHPAISIKGGAYWFHLLLKDAHYDLGLAIRSYNVGYKDAKARTEKGLNYELNVLNAEKRYVLGSISPTWTFVSDKAEQRRIQP